MAFNIRHELKKYIKEKSAALGKTIAANWVALGAIFLIGFVAIAIGLFVEFIRPDIKRVAPGSGGIYFKKIEADYYLTKTNDNLAVMDAKEKFVAIFPDGEEHKGMHRSIPMKLDGQSLEIAMGEVYHNGQPANYRQQRYEEDKNQKGYTVVIEDKHSNDYLFGEHTYEINYRVINVASKPDGADLLRFHWPVTGARWILPAEEAVARVHIDEKILPDLLPEEISCHIKAKENDCVMSFDQKTGVITAYATKSLDKQQSMEITAGFRDGVFRSMETPWWQRAFIFFSSISLLILAVVLTVYSLFAGSHRRRRPGAKIDNGASIEPLPPKNSNIFINSIILQKNQFIAPKLIDLAVNRKIQIIEGGAFSANAYQIPQNDLKSHMYSIKILNHSKLTDNEREFLKHVLNVPTIQNENYTLHPTYPQAKEEALGLLYDNIIADLKVKSDILDGTTMGRRNGAIGRYVASLLLLIFAIILTVFWYHLNAYNVYIVTAATAIGVIILVLLITLPALCLKEKGLKIKKHLKGLKYFIKMSEQNRRSFINSGEGARKVHSAISATHPTAVLYEIDLPYAILFSLEEQWCRALATEYQRGNLVPDWYVTAETFNAFDFSERIKSFVEFVTHTRTPIKNYLDGH